MIYTSNKKTTRRPNTYGKIAKARSEIANLSAEQLNDAGIDVSGIPCNPTFAVDAKTMTGLMSLR